MAINNSQLGNIFQDGKILSGKEILLSDSIEKALHFVNNKINNKKGKCLSDIEEAVLRGCWEKKTFFEIAVESDYEKGSLENTASNLWKLLSETFGIEVKKRTLRNTVMMKLQEEETEAIKNRQLTLPSLFPKPEKIRSEYVAGPLNTESDFYVDRVDPKYGDTIESLCYQKILQPGALIRITGPRYMGKTSLLTRILHHSQVQGYRTVSLDFELTEKKSLSDLNLFLKRFCAQIERELQLSSRLPEYWDDLLGSKVNCKDYFKKYLLCQFSEPLVLVMDNIDYLFENNLELAEEFFGLLRAWHQGAAKGEDEGIWKRLHLVLSYSTESYALADIDRSPLNVGFPIELPDLSADLILELAKRHGLDWNLKSVDRLMGTIGGHPHLVQIALHYFATNKNITLSQFQEIAATDEGPYSAHLRRHLFDLDGKTTLKSALSTLLKKSTPVKLNYLERFLLQSMGLVNIKLNKVEFRCQLYRQYFEENLIAN